MWGSIEANNIVQQKIKYQRPLERRWGRGAGLSKSDGRVHSNRSESGDRTLIYRGALLARGFRIAAALAAIGPVITNAITTSAVRLVLVLGRALSIVVRLLLRGGCQLARCIKRQHRSIALRKATVSGHRHTGTRYGD
jgi:hypothetical protein